MEPWAAAYERWLAARGYARLSVRKRVCQLARLSSWLEREGLAVCELNRAARRVVRGCAAGGWVRDVGDVAVCGVAAGVSA